MPLGLSLKTRIALLLFSDDKSQRLFEPEMYEAEAEIIMGRFNEVSDVKDLQRIIYEAIADAVEYIIPLDVANGIDMRRVSEGWGTLRTYQEGLKYRVHKYLGHAGKLEDYAKIAESIFKLIPFKQQPIGKC